MTRLYPNGHISENILILNSHENLINSSEMYHPIGITRHVSLFIMPEFLSVYTLFLF